MAEVVDNSLRFLTQDDISAMTTYLRSVPSRAASGQAVAETPAGQANRHPLPQAAKSKAKCTEVLSSIKLDYEPLAPIPLT
jgi:hypothetical protein